MRVDEYRKKISSTLFHRFLKKNSISKDIQRLQYVEIITDILGEWDFGEPTTEKKKLKTEKNVHNWT